MKNFKIINFDVNNIEHIKLLKYFISSPGSELVSNNVSRFVIRNLELNKKDNITNVFIVENDNNKIGLAFLNYHPKEERNGVILQEEIEIGLGLLPEYSGKHLGTLFQKEFREYLLDKYKNFNEIVARVDDDNIKFKKAVMNSGFIHIQDDEYHYKRTNKTKIESSKR